jgi:tripartite-type tricarboxylate transporter receptor subunit TctC
MNISMRAALLAATLAAITPAGAETVEEFYRGKQVRMIIGHPAGGDYDLGGRLLARHLSKHIPGNPTIVVQNMPTAASIAAANYLAKAAPRDGTVFGSFSRNVPSQAVMGQSNLEADPRQYVWLGATSLPGRVCVVRNESPVKSVDDLFNRETIVAGAGPGSSLSIVPTVLNHALKTKFKIVEGYQGAPDALLAVERGEVEGVCNTYGALKASGDHIRTGRVRVIFRAEEAPFAELPNVPSIFEYSKTDAATQLMRFIFSSVEFGRPYVMPPETPADRADAMRKAMAAAAKDPELLAEAAKLDLDMTFQTGEAVAALVNKLYATSPHILDEVKKLVPNQR